MQRIKTLRGSQGMVQESRTGITADTRDDEGTILVSSRHTWHNYG